VELGTLELESIRPVIRRQIDHPCAFSRSEARLEEFARITHRVARLDRQGLRVIERELDRLLAKGYFWEVCRWKLCLFAAVWFAEKLPFVAWRFRSQVPPRSQLVAAGRDLEAEVEAAIHPYHRLG
jgi:hypothetical protein